jgi:hypothetical protein
MSSFSVILTNRLVLNLRERAVEQLPGTVETMGKFQAALPVSRQLLSITSVRNPPFVRQDMSSATVTTTLEAVANVSVGRWQPTTSAHPFEAYPLSDKTDR